MQIPLVPGRQKHPRPTVLSPSQSRIDRSYYRRQYLSPKSEKGAYPYVENSYPDQGHDHISLYDGTLFRSLSTQSTGSYDNSSSIDDSYVSGTTAQLERERHTSPAVLTPTNSTVSIDYSSQQRISNHTTWYQPLLSPSAVLYECEASRPGALAESSSKALIGIAGQSHGDTTSFVNEPEFISPQGPSPYRHQRYPRDPNPWSGYPLRQQTQAGFAGNAAAASSISPIDIAVSPSESSDRGARRVGPLTQEQRQNANAVRQLGSCLRCTLFKEKCDQSRPCTNCRTKKPRRWKLGCVQHSLDASAKFLFPALTSRLDRLNVNRFTEDQGYFYLHNSPSFVMPFDIGLGLPLRLTVKEIEPIEPQKTMRRGYSVSRDQGEAQRVFVPMWDVPILLYFTDEKQVCTEIWTWLQQVFSRQVLNPPDDAAERWPWPHFKHEEQFWEGEMLMIIHEYYRHNTQDHKDLKEALHLPFFRHILTAVFQIHESGVETLYAHLQCRTPAWWGNGNDGIAPDSVGRFIKMLVLPLARDAAKRALKRLHELLFAISTSKESSTGKANLAFCLAFILLLYLSRTQNSVIEFQRLSSTQEPDGKFTFDEADSIIKEMERELADYIILFQEYALLKAKQAKKVHSEPQNSFERRASEFQLLDRMKAATQQYYADWQPDTFELTTPDPATFSLYNSRRLCWKLFNTACSAGDA